MTRAPAEPGPSLATIINPARARYNILLYTREVCVGLREEGGGQPGDNMPPHCRRPQEGRGRFLSFAPDPTMESRSAILSVALRAIPQTS